MNDTRTFTLSGEEFDLLLTALGLGAGTAVKSNPVLYRAIIRLENRVNEGNPHWTPYEVEDEPEVTTVPAPESLTAHILLGTGWRRRG